MSAPSAPPDNSYAIAQAERKAAREAQERADQKEAQKKAELAQLRSGVATTARGSAADYFSQAGLNPDEYGSSIDRRIQEIMGTISPDDETPGSYFDNIGEDVYNREQTNYRTKNTRALDPIFSPGFENSRIQNDFDDPYIAALESEQRTNADQIIQNMLRRGVITDTGFGAAKRDLDRQSSGVRTQLNDVGSGLLESGRSDLRSIADRGRTTASTLNLGQAFDPNAFSSEADAAFNDFISSFNDQFRSRVPGNLFDTGGLAAIAGGAQGAQNTLFDPAALAGTNVDEEDDPFNPNNKKQTEAVF